MTRYTYRVEDIDDYKFTAEMRKQYHWFGPRVSLYVLMEDGKEAGGYTGLRNVARSWCAQMEESMGDWVNETLKEFWPQGYDEAITDGFVSYHEFATALRSAYRRGQVAECHHAAAKAFSYADRELYDELTARAKALEETP